ncbi:endonuclease/exonuclease/phosphatase family protein [Anderseniella sp. Alg231-50]|uniref:endonuclease/exonuclease/phosphatase family protein n=1 Tax=Anderseniella sp. Alg231-50 TaxID=1922226 RepID=UPI000D556769
MTTVASWNIQNGKGADGVVSLPRIAEVISRMGEPDVICLQEVSRHLPVSGAGFAVDQIAELADLFPGYEVIFGVAIEAGRAPGAPRWQYGNATLSRLPVVSVFHHALPQPPHAGVRQMPRQVSEVTVATGNTSLRVMNTHLEYHSLEQRLAQIARLRELHLQAAAVAHSRPDYDDAGSYSFLDRPESCVLCGDFNIETGSPEYAAMLSPADGAAVCFRDAWQIAHADRPHDPTCGVHDTVQWPQGPHCRDFFFVAGAAASAVEGVCVDTETDASDHQPLMLSIAGTP